MVASKTLIPVIGVPVRTTTLSGVDSLYSIAIEEEDFSADIYKWTKIVNDNCDENLKLNIFRLACKIVNADGNIDPFESNFTRRLSGLLYITDKQSGEIKKEFKEL